MVSPMIVNRMNRFKYFRGFSLEFGCLRSFLDRHTHITLAWDMLFNQWSAPIDSDSLTTNRQLIMNGYVLIHVNCKTVFDKNCFWIKRCSKAAGRLVERPPRRSENLSPFSGYLGKLRFADFSISVRYFSGGSMSNSCAYTNQNIAHMGSYLPVSPSTIFDTVLSVGIMSQPIAFRSRS
jgi:hypothetical protein